MKRQRCDVEWCAKEHVHFKCENGEMLLVKGPRPYLKARDKLLASGMWIDDRRTLRRLANAILRELETANAKRKERS